MVLEVGTAPYIGSAWHGSNFPLSRYSRNAVVLTYHIFANFAGIQLFNFVSKISELSFMILYVIVIPPALVFKFIFGVLSMTDHLISQLLMCINRQFFMCQSLKIAVLIVQ